MPEVPVVGPRLREMQPGEKGSEKGGEEGRKSTKETGGGEGRKSEKEGCCEGRR